MDTIRIVPTGEQHIEGFHAAVDVVARERRYLGMVQAPPLAAAREFVHAVLAGGGVHLVAVDEDDAVVGWCDIIRYELEGFGHTGRLGMGLLPEHRDRGLGRRIAEDALARAWAAGLERVELDVFASNERAVALYERLGFATEGVKRRARKIDGRYDDNVCMALFAPAVRDGR